MKKYLKILTSLLCAAALVIPVLAGCDRTPPPPVGGDETGEFIDYASELKLDMSSNTNKQEVTVKFFIDGDTTHFNPTANASTFVNGYIKARYLAVNTPESTGDVEKWGKSASNFTHDALDGAEKIIVESNDDHWNVDSTSERYLLWIWYIPEGEAVADENYRNLNIELLQNGYGRASKTADNRYGETALAALMQAQTFKLKIYGNEKDPNWFGGDGYAALTLKGLRFHIADYIQHLVSVSGYITARFENSVYIEEYDEETGVSYGIAVYYGYKTGAIVEILSVGNYVNVVGTVGEFNGTYQISGVSYNEARPSLVSNTKLIDEEEGKKSIPTKPFAEASIADLAVGAREVSAEFTVTDEDGEETPATLTLDYGAAIMDTSVTLTNLTIQTDGTYTTSKGESAGAMSIVVKDAAGKQITLRTIVMKKDGSDLYTLADFKNPDGSWKTIKSVKGIVDYYDGAYQLAIWSYNCFEFAD